MLLRLQLLLQKQLLQAGRSRAPPAASSIVWIRERPG